MARHEQGARRAFGAGRIPVRVVGHGIAAVFEGQGAIAGVRQAKGAEVLKVGRLEQSRRLA